MEWSPVLRSQHKLNRHPGQATNVAQIRDLFGMSPRQIPGLRRSISRRTAPGMTDLE